LFVFFVVVVIEETPTRGVITVVIIATIFIQLNVYPVVVVRYVRYVRRRLSHFTD
jgi:hypothetical protein